MTYLDLLETVGTRPALVAHRGHWKQAPENSLAAIEAAIVAGADVVEIDIRMSADRVPMVFHDSDLERMTGQPSAVSDLPLSKLSELGLRARNGSNLELTDQVIPTLDEVFAEFGESVLFDLDLKEWESCHATLACVARHGMAAHVDLKQPVRSLHEAKVYTAPFADNDEITRSIILPVHEVEDAIIDAVIEMVKPQILEVKYETIADLHLLNDRLTALPSWRRPLIWVNTLEEVGCAGHVDSAASANPHEVWGELVRAGVGVIQTDLLDQFINWRDGMANATS